jgi:hypothetical protein
MLKSFPRFEIAFYFLTLISVLTAIIIGGPVIQMRFGHDVICVLDGAWRIQHGQIPHTDFSSILGCGYLGQQYLFLQLFHYNLFALSASSITLTLIALAIFFSLIYTSPSDDNYGWVLRIYTFLLILSLGLGQYHMGQGFKALTYANLYNRYSFLILLICFLLLNYLSSKSIKPKQLKFNIYAVVIALLLNYLCFVKLTYFLVALAVFTAYMLFSYFEPKKYFITLLYYVIIFGLVLLIFKVNALDMLNDYRAISKVHTNTFFDPAFLKGKFYHKYNILLLAGGIFLVGQLIAHKASLKIISLIVLLGFFSIAFHVTNYGDSDIVLLTFIPCFFVFAPLQPYKQLLSYKLLLILGCIFIAENVLSVAYTFISKKASYSQISGNGVTGFYVHQADGSCNANYELRINNGAALINRYKKPNDQVFCYDFDNPFPVLTNTQAPKNTLLVWQYKMTFSETIHPLALTMFNNVSLLLIPKCADPESSLYMQRIYKDVVGIQFVKVGENADWTLLRKKSSLLL